MVYIIETDRGYRDREYTVLSNEEAFINALTCKMDCYMLCVKNAKKRFPTHVHEMVREMLEKNWEVSLDHFNSLMRMGEVGVHIKVGVTELLDTHEGCNWVLEDENDSGNGDE